MLHRWWTYQRERFPLHAHLPVIAIFSISAVSFSALLRGQPTLPRPAILLAAFLSSLIFFIQLRVADEFKDYAEDARYRPYRPVPRGLISLRELAVLGLAGALVQLGLALWLAPALVPLLGLVWGYLVLMSVEFFARRWLKANALVYMLSHMPIVALVDLYATAWDWRAAGADPPIGLGWLLALSFFNGIAWEVGRKIRAPHDEEHGVETYSALWGRRTAVLAWLVPLSMAAVSAIGAARYFGLEQQIALLGGALLGGAALAGLGFLRAPASPSARRIEQFSGIWALVIYLAVGLLPQLWSL